MAIKKASEKVGDFSPFGVLSWRFLLPSGGDIDVFLGKYAIAKQIMFYSNIQLYDENKYIFFCNFDTNQRKSDTQLNYNWKMDGYLSNSFVKSPF